MIKSPRIANLSYQVGISRIIKDKNEVGIGFEYAKIKLYTQGATIFTDHQYGPDNKWFDQFEFFTNPTVNYYGINLFFRHFINRNRFPTGTYIQFESRFSHATFDPEQALYYGHIGEKIASSGSTEAHEVKILDVTEYEAIAETTVQSFFLNFSLGQNFSVNSFISINAAIGTSLVEFDRGFYLPRQLYERDLENYSLTWFKEYQWQDFIKHGIFKTNGPSLSLGLKLHL